jgi:hypothetical protein
MEQLRNGQTAAAQANALQIKQIEATIAKNQSDMQASMANAKTTADAHVEAARLTAEGAGAKAEAALKDSADVRRLTQENQKRQEQIGVYERAFGPGVRDILMSAYDNPAAKESLGRIADEANTSWTGFWEEDAKRMDEILFRLGVADADARHRLIDQHGLRGRGRASTPSWFLHGTPRYETYATPEAP